MPTTFTGKEMLVSGDDHMGEPGDLWEKNLPAKFRDRAPKIAGRYHVTDPSGNGRRGGWNGDERLKDMDVDGVSACVLYSSDGSISWHVGPSAGGDLELEEACIRVYNDWIIDHCKADPERLWGLGMMTLYNIDHAIEELTRCKKEGLRGASIWISAPEDLPYSSDHYERFWAAAADLRMPLGMHINSTAERRHPVAPGLGGLHGANDHKFQAMGSLGHMICSGVFERHPALQVSIAEVGIGWLPFWIQEMDYYNVKGGPRSSLAMKPSDYIRRNVTSSFIGDTIGGLLLNHHPLLQDIALWSEDYPHNATIWPDARILMEDDLGHLAPEVVHKVTVVNTCRVFNEGKLPPPVNIPEPEYVASVRAWAKDHPQFGAASRMIDNEVPQASSVSA
jgi:predicted TIM-barrel fold metal-dependent hydrolase